MPYTGCLQLPGGHLEVGESFEDCAAREILEETGLAVQHLRFLTATNDYFEAEGKHYVTIFMTCQVVDESAEPEVSRLELRSANKQSGALTVLRKTGPGTRKVQRLDLDNMGRAVGSSCGQQGQLVLAVAQPLEAA